MIQNVEELGPELQLEALFHIKILQQAGIQVPEVWTPNEVAAAAVLPWRWDAEKCLRSDDINAVKVGVSRIGDELTSVIHNRAFNAIHKL